MDDGYQDILLEELLELKDDLESLSDEDLISCREVMLERISNCITACGCSNSSVPGNESESN